MSDDNKECSAEHEVAAELSVRLVVADHYMSRPVPGLDLVYSEFRGADIKQVPVLRIFGPASDGHKACVHVHGVFPYFYIPCGVSHPEPQLLYQIAASLDKALNISLKQANSANQHVYRITLVQGLPFYGFHYKEHLFFKVFLYNPGLIKQAVELFNNGAVLGQIFQPHEAHLNFTLQFFIDFNLFGMSNVDLQTVKFRRNSFSQNLTHGSGDDFTNFDEAVKPESMCYYEADVLASQIINRQRIGKGDGIENPGLEEVWNKEKERRRLLNMSLASKSLTQERLDNETESHYRFEELFWIKISNLIEKPVEIAPPVKEQTYYPAESLEGSQLFNASDISMHQPFDSSSGPLSEIARKDVDDTIVDESVALNCSLADYNSEVTLDSEDLDFVELLKDMEQPVDDDSVLGTQVETRQDLDNSDDAEYSQIFNNETLVQEALEQIENTEGTEKPEDTEVDSDDLMQWEDSFWEGANIPQLDGTCDDEHTKKVRKRKLPRTRSLGLAHPKGKNKITLTKSLEINIPSDLSNMDEIGPSQEIILDTENPIQECDGVVKSDINLQLFNEHSQDIVDNNNINLPTDTHDKVTNHDSEKIKVGSSVLYDIEHNYEPIPGPSNIGVTRNEDVANDFVDSSFNSDSTPDKGIISFYDMSKIFDTTLENHDNSTCKSDIDKQEPPCDIKMEKESPAKNDLNETSFIRLHHSTSTIKTLSSNTDILEDNKTEKEIKRKVILIPKVRPPTRTDIVSSLKLYNIPAIKHTNPYYSNHKDVGNKIEVGQMVLKLSSNSARHQKLFSNMEGIIGIEEWRKYLFMESNEISQDVTDVNILKSLLSGNRKCVLQPVKRPPSVKDIKKWIESRGEFDASKDRNVGLEQVEASKVLDELENSQAIGLDTEESNRTLSLESDGMIENEKPHMKESLQVSMQPDGSFLCFGGSAHQHETQSIDTPAVECDFLTVMALEVHTMIRGELNPDPQFDSMTAVFISVTNDRPTNHFLPKSLTEVVVVDENPQKLLDRCGLPISVTYVRDEEALIEHVISSVKKWDPDILCAYELELSSWGYLLERSEVLGLELLPEISRITEKNRQRKWRSDDNSYEGRILGRVILNVWRMLRHELALSSYSFENTMYHILKERVPSYSPSTLGSWWRHESRLLRWIPVEYYLTRLSGTIRMLEKLDMINRTSELARLFGMQWWEVLSRGSQFRVESLMLRAARPLNLIALSPSVKQRAAMKAPECLPLIFEPESRFYADPVIVLDFQSLYPSMMIAYNYCFSTCIGRVQNISGEHAYEFGAWRLRIPKDKLEALVRNKLVHWSPVGAGFVSPTVRRGVLPALLRRILAARQAVKKSMKLQTDEAIKKALHSRQLGLKLIANVTYGYTAANFSGRMPCVEVGDSVVAKGRETLERAIKLVENTQRWNAKVVYGDTDSMFVLVPGGTREEAFVMGQEIADAVTADNPSPVALKLEKVYQPCILQTKKRYVGYMYESADQVAPVYEAKGIETVRRDGCPAGVKLLQKSLCELFNSADMSRVKSLVVSTLARLTDGQMPVHELFFTREYNGPTGYRPGAVVPPLEIARRLGSRDRRGVPRSGERVSWAICAGAPGLPLVRLARTPQEMRADAALRPYVAYYALRVLLPPLHRCLSLVGADVFVWFRAMALRPDSGVGGIVQYMWRSRCLACDGRAVRAVCRACAARPQRTVAAIAMRLHRDATNVHNACKLCRSCCGHNSLEACNNTECPVLWRLQTARLRLQQTSEAVQTMPAHLHCDQLDF